MLNTQQKRYMLKHFVISAALINAVVNGLVGYLIFAGQGQVTLWGEPSLAVDMMATVFLLTLITRLLLGWSTGLALAHSHVEAIELEGRWALWLQRLPQSAWLSAVLLGLLVTAMIVPLALYGFYLLAIESLTPASAILFKTMFAVMVGLLVTPLLGLLALSSAHAK